MIATHAKLAHGPPMAGAAAVEGAKERESCPGDAWAGSAPRSDGGVRRAASRQSEAWLPAPALDHSSAVANSVSGMVRPSALAVLMLSAVSYLDGACTGVMRSTNPAACWYRGEVAVYTACNRARRQRGDQIAMKRLGVARRYWPTLSRRRCS